MAQTVWLPSQLGHPPACGDPAHLQSGAGHPQGPGSQAASPAQVWGQGLQREVDARAGGTPAPAPGERLPTCHPGGGQRARSRGGIHTDFPGPSRPTLPSTTRPPWCLVLLTARPPATLRVSRHLVWHLPLPKLVCPSARCQEGLGSHACWCHTVAPSEAQRNTALRAYLLRCLRPFPRHIYMWACLHTSPFLRTPVEVTLQGTCRLFRAYDSAPTMQSSALMAPASFLL